MKSDREKALEDAARDFIAKVERGDARSIASYAAFKAAMEIPENNDEKSLRAQLAQATAALEAYSYSKIYGGLARETLKEMRK